MPENETPQQLPQPIPQPIQQPISQAVPTPAAPSALRRRRVLIPAATAAALALAVTGAGVGYAAGTLHGRQDSGTATTSPGSSNRTILGPGYSQGYGQQNGQYYGYAQQGQGFDQLPTDPYAGSGSGSSGSSQSSSDTTSQASGSQLTGLVRIVSQEKYDGSVAAGTGMVLTSDGEVVTNHHVVADATAIKATVMSTGKTYTATVVGTDTKADVAVLQLQDASGLSTVSTDTGSVSRGDQVTAVGDGNGTADHLSAATGTVLATDQSITTQDEGAATGENLSGLIEISSDVVGGYSGGATYDADGKVIGMTTAASSGGDVVGYAIPISTVLSVADDLESGVTGTDYSYGYPAFLGIGLDTGTTVQGVYDGTPAAKAGLAEGDTITRIDGTRVRTSAQLRRAIAAHEPGDSISVTWTDTSGSTHTATVTLGTGPVE